MVRLGWQGTQNGALLTRAEASGFDVLITLDDDMEPEQHMANRKISILVLKPKEQGKKAVAELAEEVLQALEDLGPGRVVVIGPL